METSFVVSAAFWAPVVTESQNDMAVFLASIVWTEMVANFCDDAASVSEREKIDAAAGSGRGREKSLATSIITRTIIECLLLNATVFAGFRAATRGALLTARGGDFHLSHGT